MCPELLAFACYSVTFTISRICSQALSQLQSAHRIALPQFHWSKGTSAECYPELLGSDGVGVIIEAIGRLHDYLDAFIETLTYTDPATEDTAEVEAGILQRHGLLLCSLVTITTGMTHVCKEPLCLSLSRLESMEKISET